METESTEGSDDAVSLPPKRRKLNMRMATATASKQSLKSSNPGTTPKDGAGSADSTLDRCDSLSTEVLTLPAATPVSGPGMRTSKCRSATRGGPSVADDEQELAAEVAHVLTPTPVKIGPKFVDPS